mmetsp:Transcript_44918/g.136200  ORF Transcript_44918/g.136200 Transcript_44918/m.136200 type:complete len:214 (-) Transcript_44918:802-1443(-)
MYEASLVSEGDMIVMIVPGWPARPVRPAKWTYRFSSALGLTSTTYRSPSMWIPRTSRSFASSTPSAPAAASASNRSSRLSACSARSESSTLALRCAGRFFFIPSIAVSIMVSSWVLRPSHRLSPVISRNFWTLSMAALSNMVLTRSTLSASGRMTNTEPSSLFTIVVSKLTRLTLNRSASSSVANLQTACTICSGSGTWVGSSSMSSSFLSRG